MNALTVATFNRLEDASLLKSRFAELGIPSIIRNESKLQRFWFLAEPAAWVKVQVETESFLRAKDLIQRWRKTDPVLGAVCCPQCGSSRIEYPQFTRKFITPILVELFLSLGFFPKAYYCQECQFTWPRKIEIERKQDDALGWPAGVSRR